MTPASGPVGTKVIVEGRGCGNLDEPVRLVFQSGAGGTIGAVDLGEFPVSEQDAFRATEVAVPARMDPLQGVGGGLTQPGTYQFATRPPVCAATFGDRRHTRHRRGARDLALHRPPYPAAAGHRRRAPDSWDRGELVAELVKDPDKQIQRAVDSFRQVVESWRLTG